MMAHNLEKLRIKPGACWASYDIVRKGGASVATVWSGDRSPTEQQALENAQTFAAAPLMLAALREIAAIETDRPHDMELSGKAAEKMAAIAMRVIAAVEGQP